MTAREHSDLRPGRRVRRHACGVAFTCGLSLVLFVGATQVATATADTLPDEPTTVPDTTTVVVTTVVPTTNPPTTPAPSLAPTTVAADPTVPEEDRAPVTSAGRAPPTTRAKAARTTTPKSPTTTVAPPTTAAPAAELPAETVPSTEVVAETTPPTTTPTTSAPAAPSTAAPVPVMATAANRVDGSDGNLTVLGLLVLALAALGIGLAWFWARRPGSDWAEDQPSIVLGRATIVPAASIPSAALAAASSSGRSGAGPALPEATSASTTHVAQLFPPRVPDARAADLDLDGPLGLDWGTSDDAGAGPSLGRTKAGSSLLDSDPFAAPAPSGARADTSA